MTKKNIRTASKWAFIICAASVAIICGMKGNVVGVFWPIIAAGLHYAATGYQELCDELIEANRDNAKTFDEIITANNDLAEALRQKDAETSQLLNEIETLKNKLRA